ncbi:MAG: TraI domain-containing protein [Legionellales bacterium]
MFHRQRKPAVSAAAKAQKNIRPIVSPAQFLNEDKRQALLNKIRELCALEESRYESLCLLLIESLVNYCQHLPETANSYYSQPGGLVDYALNRTEAALSLFKDFLVQDKNEVLSEDQKLWQYTLFSAALLQGIGTLFVDYKIHLFDAKYQLLKPWNPLLESLVHTGSQYDYDFQKESDVAFRCRLNLLLARTLMPASGFSWIASNPEVLAIWLALLNEDLRSAGTLGALLIRADAIAIQRYLTDFMITVGSEKTGRYGRSGTFSGGTPESLIDKEMALGVECLQWISKSLSTGVLMINKSPLFMVPGGMLMSQEVFQLFVREHPEYKNWQAVQQGFLALGLHSAGPDGNPITRFEQSNNQQMHNGIVFSEFAVALPESVKAYQLNTGKVESMSALELINKAQYPGQFTQQQQVIAVTPLQKLSTGGKWQSPEQEAPSAQAGIKSRG